MRAASGGLTLIALLAAVPATAQQITAEEALTNSRSAYSADSVSRRCRPTSGDEIVVCADRGEDQRLPEDRTRTDNGIPQAPNLGPRDIGGVTIRGCFLQKCPKPLYFLDVAALPQAPEGSDADLIAKGEKRAP